MTQPVLFRQSDVHDPYRHYMHLLQQGGLFYDEDNKLWASYSYQHCALLLNHQSALIPAPAVPTLGILNDTANLLLENLVRLSNPPAHSTTSSITLQVYQCLQPLPVGPLLKSLLSEGSSTGQVDWVGHVARQLPVLHLLQGFGFSADDRETVLQYIAQLVLIMLPVKNEQQVQLINEAVNKLYGIAEQHILRHKALAAIIRQNNYIPADECLVLITVNLLGLLIQSYEAGRGLLSNVLLQALAYPDQEKLRHHQLSWEAFVMETLRYDPPNHQTRRILQEDLLLNNQLLPKGAMVVLVLASANRDPARFNDPHQFNPFRTNNAEHLSFGRGAHACIARYHLLPWVAEVISKLFKEYPQVSLSTNEINYEPLIHARLPVAMNLSLY
jgi:cytochrome P450